MLYLKKLLIENSGPIERLEINFPFNYNATPKPVIFVGENGSGKTTALSFIVDALLQIADKKLDDVLTGKGLGKFYYRLRSHDVRLGESSSVAHVEFDLNGKRIDYVDRVGVNIDVDQFRKKYDLSENFPISASKGFEKCISKDTGDIEDVLASGSYIFFPSGRRETPHWLQSKALNPERYTVEQRFKSSANKPFIVESASDAIANWILDGILDRSAGYPDIGIVGANIILREILEDPMAHFVVAPRSVWPRVQIYTGINNPSSAHIVENPRRLSIPSLGHLSAGQSMLLSLFGTIANHGTLRRNVSLDQIEGFVLIDEVEVYLHTHLQKTVLPKLLKIFPKVQFVIATHSPSFLMGMKDAYGKDGFEVLSMPTGSVIDVDQFSEIGAAVDALRHTTVFKNEVMRQVALQNDRSMLIVEGRSDALLIEKLWISKFGVVPPFNIISAKGRRQLRYLLDDEGFVEQVGEGQRALALFDFDEAFDDWNGCSKSYPNREGDEVTGLLRRHVSKKIFAGLLPVPNFRSAQAQEIYGGKSVFTIELYVDDEVLDAEQNLETVNFPGGAQVSKFKGDKVAFANRIGSREDLASKFDPLISLINRILVE